MDTISSPDNLLQLVNHILNIIEVNEGSKNDQLFLLIKGLKYICFGSSFERITLSHLSSEDKLSSILEVCDLKTNFKLQPDDYFQMVDSVLSYSDATVDLFKILKPFIIHSLKDGLNTNSVITNKLFKHKNVTSLPVDLVEEILLLDSRQLESQIIHMYSERVSGLCPTWSSLNCRHWIFWCSRSKNLFSLATSIMNQLLITVKKKIAILEVIYDFINNVSNECKENCLDFVRLYPEKLQFLISVFFLDLDTSLKNNEYLKHYVQQQLNVLKKDTPIHALILLTHFNKWNKFVI